MSSWSIAEANLTSVGVLAFAFGFLASRLKSDVRLPDAIYQFLSVYLLFGIGLKGGHSLKETSASNLITPVIATVICGVVIPCLAFVILRLVKGLNNIDRGSFAAHYGSTSLVTFSRVDPFEFSPTLNPCFSLYVRIFFIPPASGGSI
jgi:hypothetical protein